jgi:hypothetical protein
MPNADIAYCRVCGFRPDKTSRGSDGLTPSFEIWPSCGVEYGYEDATPAGVRKFREAWIGNAGAHPPGPVL